MFFRYFFDERLAHSSYMVGCQKTGEAIVVDPSRNLVPYFETAQKEGLHITAATETHIHADFLSGAGELAKRHNVKLFLSDEGDENWKYQYVNDIDHELVHDGSIFQIGNISFEVMHTPGHTPESISFLLTDKGGGSSVPMGIFTGDFVFVGDVGRPDLLEKAAGIVGTADVGAKQMFHSLERFKTLPEHLQVWPAHGAGSACGKALGAVPLSTVGYELRNNWALQYKEEAPFVKALLSGQPEPPKYFAMMKKLNKVGPNLLSEKAILKYNSIDQLQNSINEKTIVIDTRPAVDFRNGHMNGSINIPFNKSFTNWAGWIVQYDQEMILIAGEEKIATIRKALQSIGLDQVKGYIDAAAATQSGSLTETYDNIDPFQLSELLKQEDTFLLDVRNQSEWNESHIEQAHHYMLGYLSDRVSELPKDKTLIVQCLSGARSAIATSILQANGFKSVINLADGFKGWTKERMPIVSGK